MTERLRVTVSDGKYTVIQEERGAMRFLRNGGAWLAGDSHYGGSGLVLALAQEVAELRERLVRYRYAKHYAEAEAWDGSRDVRLRFQWAASHDPECQKMSDDEVATAGAAYHAEYAAALRQIAEEEKKSK